MAEKSFGVKDINLVGAAGTPTLESNGELYINASHVAIQTNTTISGVCTATNKVEIRVDDGTPARIDYYCEVSDSHYTRLQSAAHADYSGNVEVTLPVTSGKIIVGNSTSSIDNNINTTGIITAASFYGDGSNLTGVGGGGDAATLDGIDSTSFLRSDAADIKTSGNLTFNDNVRAEFGTDVDGYIYHNNTNLIFDNTTGNFFIRNLSDDSDIIIRTDNGSGSIDDYIRCEGSTGEVQLSHYGSNKLVTKSDGISVAGVVTAISGIVTYYGDGSNLTGVDAATLDGVDSTSFLRSDAADTFSGANLTFDDDTFLRLGTGGDLRLFHNGTNSFIDQIGTGDLYIRNTTNDEDIIIQTDDGSGSTTTYFLADGDTGEAILYHYGSNKLATKSNGIDVTGHTETDTLNASGVCTATGFRTNSTVGDGSDVGFAIKYYVTANGASAYRFAGPGLLNTTDNPVIQVQRGFSYIFENSTGGTHPFRIQFSGTSIGVGTYVSGSQSGTQVFTIPHDAPNNYEYQCTIHGSMNGSLIVR